jgi:hypothetical protein
MDTKHKGSLSEEPEDYSLDKKEEKPELKIWEYVPVDKFALPSAPAGSTATGLWSSFKNLLTMTKNDSELFKADEKDLYALPSRLEKFVLPEINLNEGADALDDALGDWIESPDLDNSVIYLVGQPGSCNPDVLRIWGENHNAELIEPPDYDEILSGSQTLPGNFPEPGKLWIMPNLEKFFLRDPKGLKKIRKFFEMAETGQIGKGVAACQSFAWTYLQLVFKLHKKNVYTLQAFDSLKFQKLLSKSVTSSKYTKFNFLNILNGKNITGISSEEEACDPFFSKLAAFCRGNPLLEVKLWKEKLRLENENLDKKDEADLKTTEEKNINETIIWVSAELSEPVFPPLMDEEHEITLHLLILQDGLPEYILYKILPFTESKCRNALSYLIGSGFVRNFEGKCFVDESTSVSVRKMLFGRDYLVDKL